MNLVAKGLDQADVLLTEATQALRALTLTVINQVEDDVSANASRASLSAIMIKVEDGLGWLHSVKETVMKE